MTSPNPEARAPSITLRPLARSDFPLLQHWLQTPHVQRWWNHETAMGAIERDFGPSIDGIDKADLFIALLGDEPLGYVQRYTFLDNPGYIDELAPILPAPPEALSIDYFVGNSSLLRQGHGAAMLRTALAELWRDYPQAPCVIVPVSAANPASGRVLLRAGFSFVAQGDLAPDNPIDGPAHHVYAIARPGG